MQNYPTSPNRTKRERKRLISLFFGMIDGKSVGAVGRDDRQGELVTRG